MPTLPAHATRFCVDRDAVELPSSLRRPASQPRDSPDEEQDEAVQAPLHGSQPDAPDAHQLVGLVVAKSSGPAAGRHGAVVEPSGTEQSRAEPSGAKLEEALTHSFTLSSSSFFLRGRSHVRTSAAAVNISHPRTPYTRCTAHVMRFPCRIKMCRVVRRTNVILLK